MLGSPLQIAYNGPVSTQTGPVAEPARGVRWIWLVAFGVAFGYLEAAVVVYLRRLYYPDGFAFPLSLPDTQVVGVELGRELATLVMLAGVAGVAARRAWSRFGIFCVLFGIWDVAFYAALKGVLGWPGSLMTWDILFLLPLAWAGPVLSALLVAIGLIVGGAIIVRRTEAGFPPSPGPWGWGLGFVSLAALLAAFMAGHSLVQAGGIPVRFPWPLYLLGLVLGWTGLGVALGRGRRTDRSR